MRSDHRADLRAEYFFRMQTFNRSSLERAALVFTQGMERRNAQGRLAACALFDQVEHSAESFLREMTLSTASILPPRISSSGLTLSAEPKKRVAVLILPPL